MTPDNQPPMPSTKHMIIVDRIPQPAYTKTQMLAMYQMGLESRARAPDNQPTLPELPFSPYLHIEWISPDIADRKSQTLYTADQMRAYALESLRRAEGKRRMVVISDRIEAGDSCAYAEGAMLRRQFVVGDFIPRKYHWDLTRAKLADVVEHLRAAVSAHDADQENVACRADGATLGEGLSAEVTFAALGQVTLNVDNTYFGPHMVGVGDKVRIFKEAATPTAQRVAAGDAYPTGSDREVLNYLMQQFDAESWECPRCGHSQDCASMDSADYLRRYLSSTPPPTGEAVAWVDPRDVAEQCVDIMATASPRHHKGSRYTLPLYTHPAAQAEGRGYYLASFKRRSRNGEVIWWRPNNAGYTTDLEQAGVYTELTPGYHDSEDTVPVPVSFIRQLRVRRAVDYGDSLNDMFWAAEKLRAALAAPADVGGEA